MYLTGAVHELRPVFNHLSAGADPNLLDELKDMPFGVYGHLRDKYGIHWFFNGRK
jgi:PhnB protein